MSVSHSTAQVTCSKSTYRASEHLGQSSRWYTHLSSIARHLSQASRYVFQSSYYIANRTCDLLLLVRFRGRLHGILSPGLICVAYWLLLPLVKTDAGVQYCLFLWNSSPAAIDEEHQQQTYFASRCPITWITHVVSYGG